MNTKRQTIWLVSMLSLMVVLSAYYLFTQELPANDKVTEIDKPTENVAEVDYNMEELTENDYSISQLDQEVLDQLERDGYLSGGIFGDLLTKREQLNAEEENRIMSVLADVSLDTETSSQAIAELEQLESKDEKIAQLEAELQEMYEMALVAEELNDTYKVVVTSDDLPKSEAAKIIDQVMTVMEVRPEQVSVQYVSQP